MNIAFDVDGILTNFEEFIFEYGSRFLESGVKNPSVMDVNRVFEESDEVKDKFWKKYRNFYLRDFPIRIGSADIINNLKKDGHTIFIITNRGDGVSTLSFDKLQGFTKVWLQKNKIKYKKLVFNKGSKMQACLDNKIDVIIDDDPINILDLSKKIKVVYINSNYNQHLKGNNIYKCFSMSDVYAQIKKFPG